MYQDLRVGFRTSFGIINRKEFSMVELHTVDGLVGYGDCSALERPWYNEETRDGAFDIIKNFLGTALIEAGDIKHPEEFFNATSWIRRNRMARAAVDCALWDLYAQEKGISISKALGGTRKEIETGVSLGIEKTPEDLLKTIDKYLKEGYRRIKCKIKPGYDLEYIKRVRAEFGDIMLMVDANSAYTLKDIETFKELDQYKLLMIEQPLASDDIVDHRHLQSVMETPICLDESIDSAEDARRAIELGSCKTINIKVARVGGLTEAKRIHDLCEAHNVPVWCGGMLDTGIARAFNIAIASLPNYKLPHDIPGSDRYWTTDLVTPSTVIDKDSKIKVPTTVGLGFKPVPDLVEKYTEEKYVLEK